MNDKPTSTEAMPEIQLLANVVIDNGQGQVLLTQYDAEDERWWLPGAELVAYEHPDEAAKRALADLGIKATETLALSHIESFRGRRGWHVMFNYQLCLNSNVQLADPSNTRWFDSKALPQMAHGAWEKQVVQQVLK